MNKTTQINQKALKALENLKSLDQLRVERILNLRKIGQAEERKRELLEEEKQIRLLAIDTVNRWMTTLRVGGLL